MLKVFFFLSPGKAACVSPGVHGISPIAEDVSLLAAALRIQVCLTQLFENFLINEYKLFKIVLGSHVFSFFKKSYTFNYM